MKSRLNSVSKSSSNLNKEAVFPNFTLKQDYEQDTLTFSITNLFTSIKLDNNQKDTKVKVEIESVQIIEGKYDTEDQQQTHIQTDAQKQNSNQNIQKEKQLQNPNLQLFRKIMSSPLEDQIFLANSPKSNQGNFHIFDMQKGEFGGNNEQRVKPSQKQIIVDISMQSREEENKILNEPVELSTMNVDCQINHQRLIVNIPTIYNVIIVYSQLMTLLGQQEYISQKIQLISKDQLIKAFRLKEIKYHPDTGLKSDILFNQETRLIASMKPTVQRIYGNLYQRVVKKMNSLSKNCLSEQNLQTEQLFFEKCIKIIKDSKQELIWQIRQTALNTQAKQPEQAKNDDENDISNEDNLQRGREDLEVPISGSSQNKSYNKFDFTSGIQPQIIDDNQSEIKQPQTESQNLYFVKKELVRSRMEVCVKLKNMELWIIDFNLQKDESQFLQKLKKDEQIAQILQLKFMMDLYYESDTLSRNLICSSKPLNQADLDFQKGDMAQIASPITKTKEKSNLDISIDKDQNEDPYKEKQEQQFITEIRVLSQKDCTRLALNHLQIGQFIVERWKEVFTVLIELQKKSREFLVDYDSQEEEFQLTNSQYFQQKAIQDGLKRDRKIGFDKKSLIDSSRIGSIMGSEMDEDGKSSNDTQSVESDIQSLISDSGEIQGVQFAFCKIIVPTVLNVQINNLSESDKTQFYEMNVSLSSLVMCADFKDIDLMYYLYRKYQQDVEPALIIMNDPLAEILHEQKQNIHDPFYVKQILKPIEEVLNIEPQPSQDKNRSENLSSKQSGQDHNKPHSEQLNNINKKKTKLQVLAEENSEDELIEKDFNNQIPNQLKKEGMYEQNSQDNSLNKSQNKLKVQRVKINDEDLKLGDLVIKQTTITYQSVVQAMDVNVGSILLSLSDGEINDFIGLQRSTPQPLIELVFDSLVYQTQINNFNFFKDLDSNLDINDDKNKDQNLHVNINLKLQEYFNIFSKWKDSSQLDGYSKITESVASNVSFNNNNSQITENNKKSKLDISALFEGASETEINKQKKYYQPVFNEMKASLSIYGTYYNQISQAFEPFIEPWDMTCIMKQETEKDSQKYEIKSDKYLDFNLTYGMAVNIKDIKNRVIDKTFKIDEDLQKEKEREKTNRSEEILRKAKINQENSVSLNEIKIKIDGNSAEQDKEGSDNKVKEKWHKDKRRDDQNLELEDQKLSQKKEKLQARSRHAFSFLNYTGQKVTFCRSNQQMNEDLTGIQVLDKVKEAKEMITIIKGSRYNRDIKQVKAHENFFSKQGNFSMGQKNGKPNFVSSDLLTTDFIEGEPLTIDIKLDGANKIKKVSLDLVGVYSYETKIKRLKDDLIKERTIQQKIDEDENQQLRSNSANFIERPLKMIIKITSLGSQKQVSFESQLLFCNQLQVPLTLIFEIKHLTIFASQFLGKKKNYKIDKGKSQNNLPQDQSKLESQQIFKKFSSEKPDNGDKQNSQQSHEFQTKKNVKFSKQQSSSELQDEFEIIDAKKEGIPYYKNVKEFNTVNYIRNQVREKNDKNKYEEGEESEESLDLDQLEKDKAIQLYQNEQELKIILLPQQVFRVPLAWMCPDSIVNLHYFRKLEKSNFEFDDIEAGKQILLENIANIFNKSAADKDNINFSEGIQSQVLEFNQDLYACFDIQAYSCLPKQTQSTNPLQYVASFNPPLILTNYSMAPLEVYEIDYVDPQVAALVRGLSNQNVQSEAQFQGTQAQINNIHSSRSQGTVQLSSVRGGLESQGQKVVPIEKLTAQIPPEASSYIYELDMTKNNQSDIKFKFIDTQKDMQICKIIKKFQFPDKWNKNEADKQNESQIIDEFFSIKNKEDNGFDTILKNPPSSEQDAQKDQENCPIRIEIVKKYFKQLENYGSLESRERLIDISISRKLMIYPLFMLVNKTNKDIYYYEKKQIISKKTNDFFMSYKYDFGEINQENTKREIKLYCEKYLESKLIDISIPGVNFDITMDHEDNDVPNSPNRFKQLQFGVDIQQAPFPFVKTNIITIVPRYLIVNKLSHPIQIRQVQYAEYEQKDLKKKSKGKTSNFLDNEFRVKLFQIQTIQNEDAEKEGFYKEIHLQKRPEEKNKRSFKDILNGLQFKAINSLSISDDGKVKRKMSLREKSQSRRDSIKRQEESNKSMHLSILEEKHNIQKNPFLHIYDQNENEFIEQQYQESLNPEWSHPFPVDDVDDFQVVSRMSQSNNSISSNNQDMFQQISSNNLKRPMLQYQDINYSQQVEEVDDQEVNKMGGKIDDHWFYPKSYNNNNLVTRVIVSLSNSTVFIIFDEPQYEEYVIENKTQYQVSFQKINKKAMKTLGEIAKVPPKSKRCFVWDRREVPEKNLKLSLNYLQSYAEETVWIDNPDKALMQFSQLPEFFYKISPSEVGSRIIEIIHKTKEDFIGNKDNQNKIGLAAIGRQITNTIKNVKSQLDHNQQKHKADNQKSLIDKDHSQGNIELQNLEKSPQKDNKIGIEYHIDFKGIGFSFIDNQPKELIYMRIDALDLTYGTITITNNGDSQDDDDESFQSTSVETKIKLEIGNFQIDNMINEDMPVILGATQYFDKKLVEKGKADLKSKLADFHKICADTELISQKQLKKRERALRQLDLDLVEEDMKYVDLLKDKENHGIDLKTLLVEKRERRRIQKSAEFDRQHIPFITLEMLQTGKSQKNKLGQIIRYEKIIFGIQEFFIQIETSIVNDNLKMVMELLNIFSEQIDEERISTKEDFDRKMDMPRTDLCSVLDASKGLVFDETSVNADKISFNTIQILQIQFSLTFKLEKKFFQLDLTNPRAGFGLLGILYPLVSNLAQITGAKIQLKELQLFEGSISQDKLIENVYNHYVSQAKRQLHVILFSLDMMGNPMNFVSKISVGVKELVREPAEGLKEGKGEMIVGVGRGVQSFFGGVLGGVTGSVSTILNTLYSLVKEMTGGDDLRTEKPENFTQGVYMSIYGVGHELVHGISGIVVKPYQGFKKRSCKGGIQGLGRGCINLFICPFTGTLRFGYNIIQGLNGTIMNIANYGKSKLELLDTKTVRVRALRRIDVRGQIHIYDEDLALINKYLNTVNNGYFSSQQIKFYCVLPSIDPTTGFLVQDIKTIVVITTEFLIILQVFNFFDLIKKKNIEKSLLISERLTNIMDYQIFRSPAQIIVDKDSNKHKVWRSPVYFMEIQFTKPWTMPSREWLNFRNNFSINRELTALQPNVYLGSQFNDKQIKSFQPQKQNVLDQSSSIRSKSDNFQPQFSNQFLNLQAQNEVIDYGKIQQESVEQLKIQNRISFGIDQIQQNDIENNLSSRSKSKRQTEILAPLPTNRRLIDGVQQVQKNKGLEMIEMKSEENAQLFQMILDPVHQYKYVIHSPSLEILNRIHLILGSNPDIKANKRLLKEAKFFMKSIKYA